jgi:alpha/beta superfamily hydrolase
MYPKGNLFIPCEHGQLEAIYRPGTQPADRVALVLHPHPLFGGTMHNKVVYRAAQALQQCGFETLRINFRGTGESTGTHDNGQGEVNDARTALDYLLHDQPHAHEVIIAGFSFGSVVGLKLGCADQRVHRLIAIGCPVKYMVSEVVANCQKPKLFLHGAEDDIAPLPPLEEMLHQLPPESNYQLVRVAGAGHFFDNQLPEMMQAVADYVNR